MLFVLLGLQAPHASPTSSTSRSCAPQALVVALTVVAVRMAWAAMPGGGFGDTGASGSRSAGPGMRGAISLAAALSVPVDGRGAPGDPAAHVRRDRRDAARAGPDAAAAAQAAAAAAGENPFSPDEALARLEAAQAALDRLEELEEEGAAAEPLRRLRELYRRRFAVCVAVLGGGELPEDGRRELREYGAMRRELIAVERASLLALRNDGPRAPGRGAQGRARPRPRGGAASARDAAYACSAAMTA